MRPIRARALKQLHFSHRTDSRFASKPPSQMPRCGTQPENLRAPRGAGAPCGLCAPTRKVTPPDSGARPQLAILRAPRGAGAPCGLRAPTRKVTPPGLRRAPSTRNLARSPGRRRPVWPPRPNSQSYTAGLRGRALNSQSCALPGAPAPRVAFAPQLAKLRRPDSGVRPRLAILRAPRGAGAPCGLCAPTRKVTPPGLRRAPSTRNLARSPGRRRPVWPLRPNSQSYTARTQGCALNSQSCALPGRRRPVWPPRPNSLIRHPPTVLLLVRAFQNLRLQGQFFDRSNSRCRDFGVKTSGLPNCCEFWRCLRVELIARAIDTSFHGKTNLVVAFGGNTPRNYNAGVLVASDPLAGSSL